VGLLLFVSYAASMCQDNGALEPVGGSVRWLEVNGLEYTGEVGSRLIGRRYTAEQTCLASISGRGSLAQGSSLVSPFLETSAFA
jgi:hypothetical protein